MEQSTSSSGSGDSWSTFDPQAEDILVDPVISVAGFWIGLLINSVGIFGNILVLAATLISAEMRTGPQLFIVSLGTIDLAAILLANVPQLATLWTNVHLGRPLCMVQNIAFTQLNTTGLFHIAVIATFRCLAAVSPKRYKIIQKRKFTLSIIVIIHLATFTLMSIPKIASDEHFYFDDRVFSCTYKRDKLGYTAKRIIFLLLVMGWATTVAVAYVKIRATLVAIDQTIQNVGVRKQHQRIVKCMLATLIMFVAAYLPYASLMTMEDVWEIRIPRGLNLTCLCLVWIANSSNWIVYGLLNKDFQDAYVQLFHRCRRGNQINIQNTVQVVVIEIAQH